MTTENYRDKVKTRMASFLPPSSSSFYSEVNSSTVKDILKATSLLPGATFPMASTWINWPSTTHDMVLILSQDHTRTAGPKEVAVWTQATKVRTRMEGHMQNSLGRCAQRKKSELINNIRHCFILYSHSATFKAWTLASAKLFIDTLSSPPFFLSKIGIKGYKAVMWRYSHSLFGNIYFL